MLLMAALMLALTAPAFAQKRRPAPSAATEDAQAAADEPRTKANGAQPLDEATRKFNFEVNREMQQMRESMVRDAMGKMQRARYDQPQSYQQITEQFLFFLAFVTILGAVLWLINTIVENRRWGRVAKIQTEAHNRLLERFGTSQELLAYMETEAGKRFLEASPFELEQTPRHGFPYGRIMWPAQAGVVVLVVGVALLWLQNALPNAAQPLLVFGTLGLALGIGLVLSAGLSFLLSRIFGLTMRPNTEQRTASNHQ